MLNLQLRTSNGKKPFSFKINRVINAGFVGRDMEAVKAHIEELAREGIPEPAEIPIVFPVSTKNVTASNRIEVLGDRTSGEAEYVLFLTGDKVFVGVGSDHTDRALEQVSLSKSKQICQSIVSETIWEYDSVRDHWDDLELVSWVKEVDSDDILYQKALCGTIIHPDELLKLVCSKVIDKQMEGMIIFSGTIPLLKNQMVFGQHFKCELRDRISTNKLTCQYEIQPLKYL